MRGARRGELVVHNLVARTNRLESVSGGDVSPGLDPRSAGEILQRGRIERAVESDFQFRRTFIPGDHWLRRLTILVTKAPELAFATRPRTPVRLAAVRGHDKIAAWRYADIDRQRLQSGEQLRLRHLACRGLREFRAPEFAAGIAGHDRVSVPMRRAERCLSPCLHRLRARNRLIET